jgi:hypothetical protein
MNPRLLFLSIIIVAAPTGVEAQTLQYADTVIDVIGLRRRSLEDLERAVQGLDSSMTLTSAACAIILRDSLGFADASVLEARFRDTTWVVLTVIEPEDSGFVRFKDLPVDTLATPTRWDPLVEEITRDWQTPFRLQDFRLLSGTSDSSFGRPVEQSVLYFRDLLKTFNSDEDWNVARRVILQDADVVHRGAAALVLSNFAERDSTWYLLTEAVAVRGGMAAGLAEQTMRALARSGLFTVDWMPARDNLEALVGGTNLFFYTSLLNVLVDTKVDKDLGRHLARINTELLLDHIVSRGSMSRFPAHNFLTYISGEDFGNNREAWRNWLQ